MVYVWVPSLPAASWTVQGSGGVSAADAQGGHSRSRAENFHLFSGHVAATPGNPTQGEEKGAVLNSCCTLYPSLKDYKWQSLPLLASGERESGTHHSVWQVLHSWVGQPDRHPKWLCHMASEADVPNGESGCWLCDSVIHLSMLRFWCEPFVYALSPGTWWCGDSVQVSLCIWCPSKDYTPSDRCCLTNAGTTH